MGSWLDRLFGRAGASSRDPVAPSVPAAASPSGTESGLPAWSPAFDIDGLFVRWLLDAQPLASGAADRAEQRLLDALEAAAASGHAGSLVPRVPSVIPQLLQSLRDPARSARALARQVAQDPVLVAAVLRVASSAYYRTAHDIETIDQALLVIGDDGLRQLVASVAFRPLINVQSGHFTKPGAPRIWDQSETSGVASRMLAPHAGASSFEAYLACLLQNVGNIVALRILDKNCEARETPCSMSFCTAFGAHARKLSSGIGRQWDFPEAVTAAVTQQTSTARDLSPLAALLRACDRVSKLCMLTDVGWVTQDEARLALEGTGAIAICFAELSARRASPVA